MKAAILGALLRQVQEARKEALQRLASLQEALESEAKSTAGDKHETGRAMVQMEMEQAALRCSRVEGMLRQWRHLEPDQERQDIRGGAVVLTDRGGFIIGVPWGIFEGPGASEWRAISADAPLAVAWHGHRPGDTVDFRGQCWRILSVT